MSIQRRARPHTRLTALSFAHQYWEVLDTPLSLSCSLLSKYGEYKQLVEKVVDPNQYQCPVKFFKDYQSVKLLSRYPNLETGIDTDLVAKRKFVEAEVLCRDTNIRFRNGSNDHLSDRVKSVFCRAQRKIATILGDVPDLSVMDFSFGPGAAYGVRGDTSVYKKVTSTLECTYAFADTLRDFLEEFPGWIPAGIRDVCLIPGSQLTIVPKNAKTGRPICIEPLLNGLYQKGVGSWIRNRLKRFGVNLDDQSVNQGLAGRAFKEDLATVDFSSASDTISYMLVMDILPIDWFEFLDVARCPRYQAEGNWYNFHKFTSMGNAYTFELESLIFYALATAACEELGVQYQTGENLSVYGDDVIIPRAVFGLFSEAAEACGFRINREKSFDQGLFFESCGHDFFSGIFVRPLLLSKELNTLPSAFYAANSVKRMYQLVKSIYARSRLVLDPLLVRRFRDFHAWIVACIPPHFRIVGPEGYGDGHLIDSASQGHRRHPSWDGWWFHTYVERAVRVKLDESPSAYVSYFTRLQMAESHVKVLYDKNRRQGRFEIGEHLFLKDFVRVPEPTDNGSGYSVRGRNVLTRVKVFCHFVWQDLSW